MFKNKKFYQQLGVYKIFKLRRVDGALSAKILLFN